MKVLARSIVFLLSATVFGFSYQTGPAPSHDSAAAPAMTIGKSARFPRIVRYSGTLPHEATDLPGTVALSFALYEFPAGGAALWEETQRVSLDNAGRYVAILGSTYEDGLPLELFSDNKAIWLGIRVAEQGAAEEQRVRLVSVPYALTAGDAQSLGGRPASDFALVPRDKREARAGEDPTATVTTTTGTTNYIAKFSDNSGTVVNSLLYDSGAYVGLGTTSPRVPFDLFGNNTSVALWVTQSSSSGYGMLLQTANDSNYALNIQNSTNTVNRHVFWGDGNAWLANGAGNVGIGTTTPGVKLEVSGNALITGSLKVNGGIDPSGTGIKHGRTASSCTTGNNRGDTCSVTITWSGTAFPDTSYTAVCTADGGTGSNDAAAFMYIGSKSTTTVSVTMKTLNSLAATLSGVECIGIHD